MQPKAYFAIIFIHHMMMIFTLINLTCSYITATPKLLNKSGESAPFMEKIPRFFLLEESL